ncbi:MAG TPA: S26 family signal peptidase, partial [Candidatus Krumholzibacteria bacterium]|nr:S26 family signal peptidase [Candidatus Krumholzibacteria bacterium]
MPGTRRKKGVVREYAEVIVLAVGLALAVRTFFIQAFRIPSESMEDTLLVGDFLFANKLLYGPKL